MRQISYATAANEAMLEEMRRDPKTIYLATDAPGPLVKEFGPQSGGACFHHIDRITTRTRHARFHRA